MPAKAGNKQTGKGGGLGRETGRQGDKEAGNLEFGTWNLELILTS